MQKFNLSESFIDHYKNLKPEWGPLGEFVYLRTYSRLIESENRNESWFETVKRVVEGVFSIQKEHCYKLRLPWKNAKAQRSAQVMYDKIFNFKFLPPGRGLWMMGTKFIEDRGSAALNNPLHKDTLILTREYGWVKIGEIEGEKVHVLSNTKLYGRDNSTAANAVWSLADISNVETHPTKKITYQSKFGDTYSIIASYNHRWFRKLNTKKDWERVTTEELNVGDLFPRIKIPKYYKISLQGAEHGLFFGDGTRSNGELHQFELKNINVLKKLFTNVNDLEPLETGVPHSAVRQCPIAWSKIPEGDYRKDKRYLYGFLAGYFSADGCMTTSQRAEISSSRLDELEQIKELFTELGIRTTDISLSSISSNFKEERELYKLYFSLQDVQEDFFLKEEHREFYNENINKSDKDWLKIISIEEAGMNEVLCATVPIYEQFVIEGNCLTSNCAFCSTEDMDTRGSFAFTWTMDALMLGVGVGFDAKGAGKITIKPAKAGDELVYKIPDTREGWVEATGMIIDAFFLGKKLPKIDYSLIRPYGAIIKGFGGVASGPEPLKTMHESLVKLFESRIGEQLTSVDIVDIMNMIGVCVVAGNVRRSAEIAIGNHDDKLYTTMKDPKNHEAELKTHRWASNNSVFAEVGKTDYKKFIDSIAANGEPGVIWLENIRKFGRTKDVENYADKFAAGVNPCLSGWVPIQTTSGIISIEQIVERFNKGESFDVYSMDKNNRLTISPVVNALRTKEVEKKLRFHLSNGKFVDVTHDHKMYIIRNGEVWLEWAQYVNPKKDVPISLQRIRKSESYLRVKLNTQTDYVPEHRFVASAYEDINGKDIHHRNGKTWENTKENLCIVEHGEHSVISNLNHDDWCNRDEDTGQYLEKDNKKKKELVEIPEEYFTRNKTGGPLKFVKVEEIINKEWVYDLSVLGTNNFIANGIVVHNCGEQTLESYELCVRGNTRIQTKNGNPLIKDIIGKEVEIWNGDKWSKVIPFETGKAKLFRVYLSDGSYLDTTAGHGWHVKPNNKKIYRRVNTTDLEIGSKSISFSLGTIEGKYEPLSYEYGLFSGDGYIDNNRPMLCVCGEKSKLKDLDIKGIWYKEQIKEGYAEPYNRLSFKDVLDFEKAKELNNKTLGLPNWIFEMDKNSILNFIAGLIETDGNVCHQLNTDNYRIFGNEEKIRDLQLLLRRIGINHSSIYKAGNKGDETNFGTRNYDLFCCYIPSFECGNIPTRIKKVERIGSKYKKNNAYKISKLIDASKKQRIIKIEEIGEDQTYCFTEPENNMGVFGNVLTYQCCLVETFPSRHISFEEYKETLKYAYLYAKSVTLMPTHWEETNAVMMKNRRIGTSMSGIVDAFVKHGRRTMLKWADEGYKYLKELDEIYSNWLCIPKSIKITSVKPSGCQIKETLINTKKGIFRLEELGDISGSTWQDVDFETTFSKQINKFFVNGKVKTRIISTQDGNELEASLEHKYKIFEDGKTIWKKVEDIKIGDNLISSLGDYENIENAILEEVEAPYCNCKIINQPKKMTEKFAWLIGLMYGDGSIHEKGIRISFNRKEASLVLKIAETVKELFDIDVRVDDEHSIYINSTWLLSYFRRNNLLKEFCEELRIPKIIRTSSKEVILSFLTGLWRADGGIHNRTTWSICTVSKRFALELLSVSRAIGLNIKIKSAGPGGWGSIDRWIITNRCLGDENDRFRSKNLKDRILTIIDPITFEGKNFWLDKIVDIEASENHTYDISVPDGNLYIANGVVSHNSVSLLPGVSAGIHYPHSEYYIRRVRIASNSPLVEPMVKAGYPVETSVYGANQDEKNKTSIISFPVWERNFVRRKEDVSIWEQVKNAVDFQRFWADNNVSITVTFKSEEKDQISSVLEAYEDTLKAISFLPIEEHGYEQAPYEEITKVEYEELVDKLKTPVFTHITTKPEGDNYCNNDSCEIPKR